jgi:hypothetical protein
MIAAAHESVFREVVRAAKRLGGEARDAVPSGDVIADLVGRTDEHADALRAVGLGDGDKSVLDTSFRAMRDRVWAMTSDRRRVDGDLARWEPGLDEVTVWDAALNEGAGALALLPVAWLLAVRRAEPGLEQGAGAPALSLHGRSRIGVDEVIAPGVSTFLDEDWTYAEVMAELARRSVDQHVQIVWARMAADPRKDVAVLAVDGDRWTWRGKVFYAWRTASRINQAVGWLRQLELVGADGITSDGEAYLERALRSLSARA